MQGTEVVGEVEGGPAEVNAVDDSRAGAEGGGDEADVVADEEDGDGVDDAKGKESNEPVV